MSNMDIPKYALLPVTGTRDFPPDKMIVREWLFKLWDSISLLHNFRKYDAPIVEHSELYTRKGGDDIIKEMYYFESEKKILCLRPEMTPSLARLAITVTDTLPLKWYCHAQCWRFETVTRGRKREHYQWNADIIGENSVMSDVEILSMVCMFFDKVGLQPDEVSIRISHRGLLQGIFEYFGINNDLIVIAFNIVDKIEKLKIDEFMVKLIELGLTDDQIKVLLKFTECKSISALEDIAIDNTTWNTSLKNITDIINLCNYYNITKWLEFDASIVRGLSYYTGMVFEGFFKKGITRKALVGGGRYDNLTKTYKPSSKLTSVGFGMGDIVIIDVLQELNKLPTFTRSVSVCIGSFNNDLFSVVLSIATMLRDKDISVDICSKVGPKHLFSYADKIGAIKVIMVAPDEWINNGLIVVKNLRDGSDKSYTCTIQEFSL